MSAVVRKVITPIDILRNCRGKPVSIELVSRETVNGTVMSVDRAMNVVVKQGIRTAADGEHFWKSRECLIRGATIKNVRMDESALKVAVYAAKGGARKGGGPRRAPASVPKAQKHARV